MSPITPSLTTDEEIRRLQTACRACTRCVADGLIEVARPVVAGSADARFFVVGQAPGVVEFENGWPFAGRAGRELARWMMRAGFESEEDFRRRAYIAAVMRCFPGRDPKGGDRRPPPLALRNCGSWLDAELELLRPPVIIALGQLAIERFLGPGPLEARVGRTFGMAPVVVPLPHPSGQSRWLNGLENRVLLERGLNLLSDLRDALR